MSFLRHITPVAVWLCLASNALAVKWDTNVQTLTPDLTKPYADVVFHFQNDGKDPLVISDVISSCAACVSAQFDHKEYASGEGGTVTAHVDLNAISGVQRKYLTVKFADANIQPAQLIVVVNMPSIVIGDPNTVEWKAGEGTVPKTVKIRSLVAGGKLEVVSVTPLGSLKTTIEPMSKIPSVNNQAPGSTNQAPVPNSQAIGTTNADPDLYLLTITPSSNSKSGKLRLQMLAPGGTPIYEEISFQRH